MKLIYIKIIRRISLFFGWWLAISSFINIIPLFFGITSNQPINYLFMFIPSTLGLYYLHIYKYERVKLGCGLILGLIIVSIILIILELSFSFSLFNILNDIVLG